MAQVDTESKSFNFLRNTKVISNKEASFHDNSSPDKQLN